MYHPTTLFLAILALVSGLRVLAQTAATLSYDTNFDNSALSLNNVACSNGPNGLETKNYTTLGSLPCFPYAGAAYTVTGWNSPQCGACYAVTYGSTTINVLAVDKATTGFTIGVTAMNALTGGQAVALGRVNVSFVTANASACGM